MLLPLLCAPWPLLHCWQMCLLFMIEHDRPIATARSNHALLVDQPAGIQAEWDDLTCAFLSRSSQSSLAAAVPLFLSESGAGPARASVVSLHSKCVRLIMPHKLKVTPFSLHFRLTFKSGSTAVQTHKHLTDS
jgi:hypothetical protein